MLKKLKKAMFIIFIIISVLALGLFLFLRQDKFGRFPEGARLERIQKSPNYRDGSFQNQIDTPRVQDDVSFVGLMWDFWFVKKERLVPKEPLPSRKTDLKNLPPDRDTLVWFGHSTVFLRLHGWNILIDPVLSDHAAPVSFSTRAFPGTNLYQPEELPDIDYLLISHDHWDHLDYQTLLALKPRIGKIICPLGVGAHLEAWGFRPDQIVEGDWYDRLEPELGLTVHFRPARHFSGRTLKSGQSLWAGFVLETPGRRIFYSGDTGYGPHLAETGADFDGFDLVILENGQYDPKWKLIHMMPEETAQAAEELKGRLVLPVHSGRFTIANHSWDDPFKRLAAASEGRGFKLATPLLGDTVWLDEPDQAFSRWWEGLE